ncbi:hypothetical protein MACH26_10050 [Planctobacterium marinum]|uniref:Uncharacterized protein n=1 Tax=Planctobacterium marinum TaxID=1631968 RepID=A0AA48HHN5_9ALTE|nr:hypothetical protein MACH26_10050 [Planctobacterium marinum]
MYQSTAHEQARKQGEFFHASEYPVGKFSSGSGVHHIKVVVQRIIWLKNQHRSVKSAKYCIMANL